MNSPRSPRPQPASMAPVPPSSTHLAPLQDREIWLGVRPEHIRIADSADSAVPAWPATVEVVEPTGAETQVVARLGAHQLTSTIQQRRALQPGQSLQLQADPAHWHVFDRASGARLN